MTHWILTRPTADTITQNLDRNLMTLDAARNYFAAYGVNIKGRTKDAFIRALWQAVRELESHDTR